jgi:hypothetical protein
VQSSVDREKKALQWTVDYFRKNAADLTPVASKRRREESALKSLVEAYQDKRERDDDAPEPLGIIVNAARDRLIDIGPTALCKFAATLLERGDSLPPPLQSAAVRNLADFLARLSIANGGVGERHRPVSSRVGIERARTNTIPTKIPTNRLAGRDYGRTNVNKSCVIELFLQRFRTFANICEHQVVPRGGIEPPTP